MAFAQRLPWLLFPVISGAVADRLDRRRAMAGIGLLRAVVLGMLGLCVLAGIASIPLLYAAFFLIGTGETLFDTASAGIVPAVVPREALPAANARLFGTTALANQFVGPALGGLLFGMLAAGGSCSRRCARSSSPIAFRAGSPA